MAGALTTLLGLAWLMIVATKAFKSCALLETVAQVVGHDGPLRTAAILVVLIESAAAWLLLARSARAGAVLGALLVLAFSAVTLAAGGRIGFEGCGCYPAAPSTAGGHLLVNGVLLVLHGTLLALPHGVRDPAGADDASPAAPAKRPRSAGELGGSIAVGDALRGSRRLRDGSP